MEQFIHFQISLVLCLTFFVKKKTKDSGNYFSHYILKKVLISFISVISVNVFWGKQEKIKKD